MVALFTLDATHQYHGEGPCPAVEIEPASQTLDLMRRTGLLHRTEQGRLSLHAPAAKLPMLRRVAEQDAKEVGLLFRVRALDPHFDRYTTEPVRVRGFVRYLDSGDTADHALDGSPQKWSQFLSLDRPPLVDAHGEPRGPAPVEMRGLQDVLGGSDYEVPPLAVVRIRLVDALSADAAPHYVVSFSASDSVWRYHLIGALADPDARIVDLTAGEDVEPVEFAREGDAWSLVGKSAITFVSTSPIPLRERPSRAFELRRNGGVRETVVVKRLPLPTAEGIGLQSFDDGHAVVSDIYVND